MHHYKKKYLKANSNFWLKPHEFSDVPIEPPKNPQFLYSAKQVK
jgi:hypothetical protein